MNKQLKALMLLLIAASFSLTLPSCGGDDDEPGSNSTSIAGTWIDGEDTLTLGRDGSYREEGYGQYRIGTYSYNPANSLMTVNVKAIAGMNSAYQQTYIVQTLTSTTLVLLYTDGDVKGYYTRN